MASSPPAYPVYLSPDGETEQIAATPAREAQLKFAGWRKLTQPRAKTTPKSPTVKASDAPKPKQAKG